MKAVRNVIIWPLLTVAVYIMVTLIATAFTNNAIQANIVAAPVLVVFAMMAMKYLNQENETKVNNTTPAVYQVVVFLLMWFAGQMASTYIQINNLDPFAAGYTEKANSSDNSLEIALAALIIAPIVEELIVRGVIYKTMRRSVGVGVASVLSASIFAVLHGTVSHFVFTLPMGIFLALLYESTQKIRYPILAHVVFNMVSAFNVLDFQSFSQELWVIIIMYGAMVWNLFAIAQNTDHIGHQPKSKSDSSGIK